MLMVPFRLRSDISLPIMRELAPDYLQNSVKVYLDIILAKVISMLYFYFLKQFPTLFFCPFLYASCYLSSLGYYLKFVETDFVIIVVVVREVTLLVAFLFNSVHCRFILLFKCEFTFPFIVFLLT